MKILILSATTGGGHMSAANALKEYIMSVDSTAEINIIDTIQAVSPTLNKAVTGGYVYLATKTPKMYGGFYKIADKDTSLNKAVTMATTQVGKKLLPIIEKYSPDIIITTHSFSSEMASTLKGEGDIDIPIISIITDFAPHKTYINENVDAYIVSSEEMVENMVERGVPIENIYPFGIPVKQEFYNEIQHREILIEEGLDPDLKTVLIMAGSFGVTDVLKIYHNIVNAEPDFQIILITGRNEKLYETFDRYLSKTILQNALIEEANSEQGHLFKTVKKPKKLKPFKPTKLLYFTEDIPKYMHVSDLIVTKPGGLTVSEAIASNLPIAAYKPIPGQEEQNVEFLTSKNMALRLIKGKECTNAITELLTDDTILEGMRASIKKYAKENSSANIYELLKKLCDEKQKLV